MQEITRNKIIQHYSWGASHSCILWEKGRSWWFNFPDADSVNLSGDTNCCHVLQINRCIFSLKFKDTTHNHLMVCALASLASLEWSFVLHTPPPPLHVIFFNAFYLFPWRLAKDHDLWWSGTVFSVGLCFVSCFVSKHPVLYLCAFHINAESDTLFQYCLPSDTLT